MIDFLFNGSNAPFLYGFALCTILGVLEIALVFSGLSGLGAEVTDGDADTLPTGNSGHAVAWLQVLGFGRIPFLVWLLLLHATFAVSGLMLQGAFFALRGDFLPWYFSVPATLCISLPLTGLLSGKLGRLVPGIHTTAISADSLCGKVALVSQGNAKKGLAALARVRDEHGYTHYVLVEPQKENVVLREDDVIVLTNKQGSVFHAVGLYDDLDSLQQGDKK